MVTLRGFACLLILAVYFSSCYANLEVTNGDEVNPPHSLPYIVALETQISGNIVRCGGSLIRTDKILTAASCLSGSKSVNITLGAHNLDKNEDTQKKLTADNFTIHDGYNATTRINDIAIIHLAKNESITNAINTISTPTIFDVLNTYADELGTVAGWGKINDTSSYSPVLRKIDVTIIPFLSCTLPYLGKVKMTQICTTGMQDDKNICQGDRGSPLTVNGTQVGIVSYGSDFGCSVGFPGVHTRLTSYYFWLKEKLNG